MLIVQSLKLVKDDVVPPLQEGLKNTLNSVFTGIPSLVQKVKNIMVYQYSVKCGVVVGVGGMSFLSKVIGRKFCKILRVF